MYIYMHTVHVVETLPFYIISNSNSNSNNSNSNSSSSSNSNSSRAEQSRAEKSRAEKSRAERKSPNQTLSLLLLLLLLLLYQKVFAKFAPHQRKKACGCTFSPPCQRPKDQKTKRPLKHHYYYYYLSSFIMIKPKTPHQSPPHPSLPFTFPCQRKEKKERPPPPTPNAQRLSVPRPQRNAPACTSGAKKKKRKHGTMDSPGAMTIPFFVGLEDADSSS
jgi:hypothetical protein